MAESRQQLIQGSSFFQRQKEKLGSFMAKRSTITGAAFKKGTSQESSDKIEKRVGNNEKKITFLKKIIKTRKDNVDKRLGTQSTLLDTLQSIAASVDSIRDTLIQRQESGEESADDRRTQAEQTEMDLREKNLEKGKDRFAGLKKAGNKIVAPVMSLWERIWNFIKTLFLGKILLNFLKWMADPANQKKIASFGRFVKTFWPALLTGALLFMTGLGGLITSMTTAIALWIPKMIMAIGWLKAKALIGGAGMMGFGRKAVSAFSATRIFKNEGGLVPGSGNSDTVPAMLTPGEVVMSKGAVKKWGRDALLGMNAAGGGKAMPKFSGGNTYFRGGGIVNRSVNKPVNNNIITQNFIAGGEVQSLFDLGVGDNIGEIEDGAEREAIEAQIKIEKNINNTIKSQSTDKSDVNPQKFLSGIKTATKSLDSAPIPSSSTSGPPKRGDFPNTRAGAQAFIEAKNEYKADLTLSDDQETKSSDEVSRTVDRTNDGVEVVNAQQNNDTTVPDGGGSGNEIPSFDVGVTRDVSKIRTLGIMLL